jgi:hypothetical protein
MSNDQRGSSRGLWRTFHVQPPSRLGKARFYLASRQPVELHIPPSTHLLGKYSQIQGFITRTKAEPYDQIAGHCRDLFSGWVKEWQSHRGALVVSGSRKRAFRAQFRQVYIHRACDFALGQVGAHIDSTAAKLGLSACALSASGPLGLDRKGFDAARSCLRLRFGTPLWRVPIVAIYRPKTRAECRGTSPEAGIEWSTGSEPHEIPSIARPCRRPPH